MDFAPEAPDPGAPDSLNPGIRPGIRTGARGGPRRWAHRLLIGLIGVVSLAVVGAGGVFFYVRHQLGKIHRIDVPGLSDPGSGQPMNVLLVGSDSRERVSGDLAEATGKGKVTGQRSDTIMVLHVDQGRGKAAIVSIPRDLYVPIAGAGFSDRVNTAFSLGGAKGLVDTVEAALSIQINHYMEVDFVGFKDIVDAVGGVKVYVPNPVRDRVSGLAITQPGCASLDGTAGLALVRSRNYESLVNGRWQVDPTADLGRILRQQDFIRRMLSKVVASGITNPVRLNRLVNVGTRDLTIDTGMSTGDLLSLARRFRSLDPGTVDMTTLPTRGTSVRGASVLLLQKAAAQPLLDRLNGVVPPAPPASSTPATKPTTTPTATTTPKPEASAAPAC